MPKSVIDAFHPAVSGWFRANFEAPTPAQTLGWPSIASGHHTLIAAPTGSGKTLAAFLAAIDALICEGQATVLPDQTRVVYVSPLKALSTDVNLNLQAPIAGIREHLKRLGHADIEIRTGLRTGDTPASKRAAMLRRPPHFLVTTPESLYILITSERGRELLRTTQQVIIDEIHAVLGDRRGAHLALTIARLEALCGRRLVKVGLSATQKPIEEVARYLVGHAKPTSAATAPAPIAPASHALGSAVECNIIDVGHRRPLDLAIEVPKSPLDAVMSHEVWEEIYDRIAQLIEAHQTTLVFVNTRRLAERLTRHISRRLGEHGVASHHGSLAKELRLRAEQQLKSGELRCLVATASLELGIDIGSVDLVCQIGSTSRIATFLQRIGRSGHAVGGLPRGRLFALSRDQLIEATALLAAVRRGELDRLQIPDRPRDVLAQQMIAEIACGERSEDDLFDIVCTAYPYRNLERSEFDAIVQLVARGYSTHRGRRAAYLHHDAVHQRLSPRRGARLAAITSGGAIPELADYEVILEPSGMRVGSINEDFAIESMAGDIFQLGNASWRILSVTPGKVRVADAKGQPPTIPFWLGEAPSRSLELSRAVSDLRSQIDTRLAAHTDDALARAEVCAWLQAEHLLSEPAAHQIAEYLATSRLALGRLPTQRHIILERFFDESGGMQLVIHAPFGSRLNRAWGLALRKCFCRSFNFELQAAATEDAIVLSLGPTHSFPLADVWSFLHSSSVRGILVQALLDAPMFLTRWRWNTTRSLAVLRMRGGKRVAPQLQRVLASDLLTTVFPDQVACLENIAGDREIPDDPLVLQTIDDCLIEAMDIDGLEALLRSMEAGELELQVCELTEPSPLSHEILNANPYAFLDDAPLEERRTQAVMQRRCLSPQDAARLGALDPTAIERVRAQAWPDPRDANELHDALMMLGWLTSAEVEAGANWSRWLTELQNSGRAITWELEGGTKVVTCVERGDAMRRIHPKATCEPDLAPPPAFALGQDADPTAVLVDLVRCRIEGLGPTTSVSLAESVDLPSADIEAALLALEASGIVMRGHYSPEAPDTGSPRTHANMALDAGSSRIVEWCERGLLARIHRYTIDRLRAEIEPVTRGEFVRFSFAWHHVDASHRTRGREGLSTVLEALEGWSAAADAWESELLASRVQDYDRQWIDQLCMEGHYTWKVLPTGNTKRERVRPGPLETTPITFIPRSFVALWREFQPGDEALRREGLSSQATQLMAHIEGRGALFFEDLGGCGLLRSQVELALSELVGAGLVTSDGFAGLRGLLRGKQRARTLDRRPRSGPRRGRARGYGVGVSGLEHAGRWAAITPGFAPENDDTTGLEHIARVLLRRWGVVFRALLLRERGLPPWRQLLRAYRNLEARGEIRGGRFVQGFSGEQFALPEAVGRLRATRKRNTTGQWWLVSARDPLNFSATILPCDRIAAQPGNRLLYRDGELAMVREAGEVRNVIELSPGDAWQATLWLERGQMGHCIPRATPAPPSADANHAPQPLLSEKDEWRR
ncbi:MAG: DEAD/DEAH box helicase [Nannocystaceae bacterium]